MIVPLFLMNRGCPHRCVYCNTRQIAGKYEEPLTEDHIHRTVSLYTAHTENRNQPVELAFYGGNFTGMDRSEQIRLLNISDTLIKTGMIHQVRIATRPDDLDEEILEMLKRHRVETIEIGAQSYPINPVILSKKELCMPEHFDEDLRETIQFHGHLCPGLALMPLRDCPERALASILPLLEYAAYGIPVSASDAPPYHDHVKPGLNGQLAENTSDAWFAALENFLCEPQMQEAMRRATKEWLVNTHALAGTGSGLADIFEQAISNAAAAKSAKPTVNFQKLDKQPVLQKFLSSQQRSRCCPRAPASCRCVSPRAA